MTQHALQHAQSARSPATPGFTPTTPAFTLASVPSSSTSAFSTTSFRNAVAQITNLAEARSVQRRAAEALLLVLDPRDEVTEYEWSSILGEISAYTAQEWYAMPIQERRSIATQVLEDCGKMELIRDTIATYEIGKERLDEIMRGLAGVANEGIKRRLVREGRMSEDQVGDGEETMLEDTPDDSERWYVDTWV